jgi:CRP/FNR family transcriptional regulator, cyclic AMP receptor protein
MAAGSQGSGDVPRFGDPRFAAAWRKSFFSELPSEAAEVLLDTAYEVEFEAGQTIYREVTDSRFALIGLVLSGVVCIYVTSPRGRRVTVRYVRPGGVVGLTSLFIKGVRSGIDAATPGAMLRMDPVTLRNLAENDKEVSWPVVRELAQRVNDDGKMRHLNLFGSVRVRVARHLLELMVERGDSFAAQITQQELADAVGSVREVVARILLELAKDGVIERDGRWIAIRSRERLNQLAYEDEGPDSEGVESQQDATGAA